MGYDGLELQVPVQISIKIQKKGSPQGSRGASAESVDAVVVNKEP